jgi:hypothetical protein
MPPCRRRPRRSAVTLLVLVGVLLAACGGGSDDGNADDKPTSTTTDGNSTGKDATFVAQVASYELLAGKPNRFLAALAGNGTGTIVSYGKVALDFFYLGTRQKPVDPPQPKLQDVEATFSPVAGQQLDLSTPGPKEAKPSEGIGVYRATDVTSTRPASGACG